MLKFAVLGLLLAVQACDPNALAPTQKAAICAALVKGIPYNTYDKNSQRYAAKLLAMDVHQHNLIWSRLGCG